MNNLSVITSHSLNDLVKHLADDLRQSSNGPLEPETIIVQSSGMSRWLSIEIARSNGICACIDYRFPNAVIEDIFSRVVPESVNGVIFNPSILAWRIMQVLPELMNHHEFASVKNYCKANKDDRALLQFSNKVADCFDQYTIYRPDMILEWDQGKGSGWQPVLWRTVSDGYRGQHRVAQLNAFRERISNNEVRFTSGLPDTIRLFGVSYLPVFYLEILALLSRRSKVVIYLLNPCGEFWGDIVSRKKLAAIALQNGLPLEEASEYYETGNPLLSSLGIMGQEFFNLLLDYGANCENLDATTLARTNSSLLKHVQSDILQMYDSGGKSVQKTEISDTDLSVQIHSCHGPLREVQVLYDNLLQMFEQIDDLEPRQIIVMTPDIESYAPYISAVFGTRSSDHPEIPYAIADRSQRVENQDIETFLKILKIPTGRFGINQILDLLESGAVMTNFDISIDEIGTIREWLTITRVRWGIDAAHREQMGFPAYDEYSWQAALDRLMLGYAMSPDADRLYKDILPCDGIEGRKTMALGKLFAFFDQLKETALLLTPSRTLSDWADILVSIINNMMKPTDQSSVSIKPLFEALQTLRNEQSISGFTGQLSLEALTSVLVSHLDVPGASFGFMSGKVTFCAMLPMRSIPFRIICMIGMNDSLFPRISRQPGFSLLNGKRMRGDRSLREEDRYLFLEALISAGERLLITYTGQSNRDNSEIPPSVVVSELVDYIASGFKTTADSVAIQSRILIKHKLQSFSPVYFNATQQPPWFTYSGSVCRAIENRSVSGTTEMPFCDKPLPELDLLDIKHIDLNNLLRFFSNPAAYFLAVRFGIRPHKPDAELEEREPFTPDALDNYNLKQGLIRLLLEGKTDADLYASAKAASILPPMAAGRYTYNTAAADATTFIKRLSPHLGDLLEPLTASFQLGEFTVTGKISGIRRDRHLRYRCANIKGKDRLSIWIEHLFLNIAGRDAYPRQSLLVCRDAQMSLPLLNNAADILHDLLRIYMEGLSVPIPVFPESSYVMFKKGSSEAEKCWTGSSFNNMGGECDNPANMICFGRHNPLNDEFRKMAARIYAPMLEVVDEYD